MLMGVWVWPTCLGSTIASKNWDCNARVSNNTNKNMLHPTGSQGNRPLPSDPWLSKRKSKCKSLRSTSTPRSPVRTKIKIFTSQKSTAPTRCLRPPSERPPWSPRKQPGATNPLWLTMPDRDLRLVPSSDLETRCIRRGNRTNIQVPTSDSLHKLLTMKKPNLQWNLCTIVRISIAQSNSKDKCFNKSISPSKLLLSKPSSTKKSRKRLGASSTSLKFTWGA